jgi:hypothetical protein
MSASIALVVVVLGGGASNPAVDTATVQAAEQALGPSMAVDLEQATDTSDEELLRIAEAKHASIALVRWTTPSSAVVHFHGWGGAHWIDRTVVFQSEDAPAERGRAVGFTLASMMPEAAQAPPPTLPPTPPPITTQPKPREAPPWTPDKPRRWLGSVDATVSGAFVPQEYGTGLGAQLGVSLLWRRLGVRLGWSIRGGDVPPAQATALYMSGGLGLGVQIIRPNPHQRIGFQARIDALLLYQSLTHLSADDVSPAHQDRWLPGADAVLLGTFDLTSAAAVVVATGVETAFGTTQIVVGAAPVAQVFPVRILADIGVLARF